MRYVPLQYVVPGNYLAKPLVNDNGQILLNHGVRLTESLLRKIWDLGYRSVYINDQYSEEEIEDVLKIELKQQAHTALKQLLSVDQSEKGFLCGMVPVIEHQIQETVKAIVDDLFSQREIIINMVDIKKADDYTFGHSVNAMFLAVTLGIKARLNREQIYDLAVGALLHDVGKVFTPSEILKKTTELTEKEYQIIQQHPSKGFEFLKQFESFRATARIVSLQHHERINGSGYPRGLKGSNIHIFSKITAIADVYDALTSDRYYRKALPAQEALAYVAGGSGILYDEGLIEIFVEMINPYPAGTLVRLSNQMEGVVAGVNLRMLQRPVIKILAEQGKGVSPWLLDLSKEEAIYINQVIYNLEIKGQ